jgi:hypothetical protein
MKTQHTPGPWELAYNEDGSLQIGGNGDLHTSVFSSAGFGIVAQVCKQRVRILGDSQTLADNIFQANANLIAAAPELFSVVLSYSFFVGPTGYPAIDKETAKMLWDQASAAIKKAKGETP